MDADQNKMLDKIRALLAKAESTTFPEEAKALTAKAEELMVRWAIDEGMLDAAKPGTAKITVLRITIPTGPYQAAHAILMSKIAAAHGCRCIVVSLGRARSCELVGYESDLRFVEMIYTSCLLQAAREMANVDNLARMAAECSAPAHKVAWKNAFMLGYANQISERLQAQRARTERTVTAERGSSVALVLVNRERAVGDHVRQAYPNLRTTRSSAGSRGGSGYGQGRAAGARADLGGTKMGGGSRGALGAGR